MPVNIVNGAPANDPKGQQLQDVSKSPRQQAKRDERTGEQSEEGISDIQRHPSRVGNVQRQSGKQQIERKAKANGQAKAYQEVKRLRQDAADAD